MEVGIPITADISNEKDNNSKEKDNSLYHKSINQLIDMLVKYHNNLNILSQKETELDNNYNNKTKQLQEYYKQKIDNIVQEGYNYLNRNITKYDKEIEKLNTYRKNKLNDISEDKEDVLYKMKEDLIKEIQEPLNEMESFKDESEKELDKIYEIIPLQHSKMELTYDLEDANEIYMEYLKASKVLSKLKSIRGKSNTNKLDYLDKLFISENLIKDKEIHVRLSLMMINITLTIVILLKFPSLLTVSLLGFILWTLSKSIVNSRMCRDLQTNTLPVITQMDKVINDFKTAYVQYRLEDSKHQLEDNYNTLVNQTNQQLDQQITELTKDKESFQENFDINKLKTVREREYQNEYKEKQSELDESYTRNKQEISNRTKQIQNKYTEIKNIISEKQKEFKTCFENYNLTGNLVNTNYHIGYENHPLVDERTPYFLETNSEPLIFLYEDETYRTKLQNLIKYLICQTANNLGINNLNINIVDSIQLGANVGDIVTKSEYSTLITDTQEVRETISNIIKEVSRRNGTYLGNYIDVEEYNKEKVAKGSMTLKYQVNLFVNVEPQTVFSGEFKNFMTQSRRVGIINFLMINKRDLFKEDGTLDIDKMKFVDSFKNVFTIKEGKLEHNNLTLPENFIPAWDNKREDFTNMIEEIDRVYEKGQLEMIYSQELVDKVLGPEDNYLKGDTTNGIELYPGFLDGERDKPIPVGLNDLTPHAIMGGTTGSGKSNTLNVMIDILKKQYSPKELELYMADFKIVEFSTYAKPHKLAQARAIAATRDIDYCVSLFEKIIKIMHDREKLFKQYEVVNIQGYRKKSGKVLPRVVFLIDEFQQLFLIDDELTAMVKKYIEIFAKLGRATGVHLFFASQSMEGTVGDDILAMFSLKIALNCSKDTSKSIIGNDEASKLPKLGFAIINETSDGDVNANKLYRVPYIPDDYRFEGNRRIIELCKERGIEYDELIFFNEDDKKTEEWLVNYIDTHEKDKKDQLRFVLGDPTQFTTSPLPVTIELGRHENSNLLIIGKDNLMVANILKTVAYSLKNKDVKCILQDSYPLLNEIYDIKDDIDFVYTFENSLITGGQNLKYPYKFGEWLEQLEYNYNARMDDLNRGEFNPDKTSTLIYICNGFSNLEGLGGLGTSIDSEVRHSLTRMLSSSFMVKIHCIFIGSEVGQFGRLLNQFNYRLISEVSEECSFSLDGKKKFANIDTLYYQYQNRIRGREFKILGVDLGFADMELPTEF